MIDLCALNITHSLQMVAKIAGFFLIAAADYKTCAAGCFHASKWINQGNKEKLISVLTFAY